MDAALVEELYAQLSPGISDPDELMAVLAQTYRLKTGHDFDELYGACLIEDLRHEANSHAGSESHHHPYLYFGTDGVVKDHADQAVGHIVMNDGNLAAVRAIIASSNAFEDQGDQVNVDEEPVPMDDIRSDDTPSVEIDPEPATRKVVRPKKAVMDVFINFAGPRTLEDNLKQLDRLLEAQKTIPAQRTEGWYRMREGCLTASDLAAALGESKYDKPFDVIEKKCGGGKPFKGNEHTQWGVKYEPVATSIFELKNNVTVLEFGLLPHRPLDPDNAITWLAASPDGIVKESGAMLEIKVMFYTPYHADP